jgi:hypothetical protein
MAEILKLPLETYKSIESGRFRDGVPHQKTLDLILERFGAVWSTEQEQWESCYPGLPFTLKNYELWKHAQFDRISEADALCNGLISLLLRVSDRQFASLSDAVYRELHRLARTYGIFEKFVTGLSDVPEILYVDAEFREMDLAVASIWRSGERTLNPEDIIGLRRERAFLQPRKERELLDFRYRTKPVEKDAPVQPTVLPKVEPLRQSAVTKPSPDRAAGAVTTPETDRQAGR